MARPRAFRTGDRVRVGPDGPIMTVETWIRGQPNPFFPDAPLPADTVQTVWFIQRAVRRAQFLPGVLELAEDKPANADTA
jgi:uncharacterized protein YodC (DUF2158 family)